MAHHLAVYENLSRLQAEEMLATAEGDGIYLVRQSESSDAQVVSMLFQNRVNHFRIFKTSDGRLRLESQAGVEQLYFDGLDQLLAYYSVPERGLPCALKCPLVPQQAAESDDGEETEEDVEADSVEESIALFFKQQYQALFHSKRLPGSDATCDGYIRQYIAKGIKKDLKQVKSGEKRPVNLQQLLVDMAEDLSSVLQTFSKRLDVLHDLFDVGNNSENKMLMLQRQHTTRRKQQSTDEAPDLDSMLNLLSNCKSHVLALERKACGVLKDYVSPTVQTTQTTSEQESYHLLTFPREKSLKVAKSSSGVPKLFEVVVGPWKTKQYIVVDTKTGLVAFKKNHLDDYDSSNTFNHDQILQLVKPNDSKTKLGIRMENKALKTYQFTDFRARELFCQLIKCIRNLRSKSQDGCELSVLIGTWNMGDTGAPNDLISWFRCEGSGKTRPEQLADVPYDIVAIGTQETAGHEKEWISRIKNELKSAFQKEMKLLSCVSLWGIRLVIFVQPEHLPCITRIKQSSVRTGIANTLGNKGAVGVSFSFNGTSLCFINCHLTSGNEKLMRRNQNFRDILRGLHLGQSDTFGITNCFHYLFWFGDLNYRVDKPVTEIIKMIMSNDLRPLALEGDQLIREQMRGTAFFGFEEENLDFQPTYRYKPGARDEYVWQKLKRSGLRINVPSWCDRVLWRSFPGLSVTNTSYGCTDDICTSDHSPVFASFELGMLQQLSQLDCPVQEHVQQTVKIQFLTLQAKIRTSSKTKFSILMMSSCMEGGVKSRPNSVADWHTLPNAIEIDSNKKVQQHMFSYPCWMENDLPIITPALTDLGYLEDQFILMAVKGNDGDESYGEFVLPVAKFLTGQPTTFEYPLSHLGEESGVVRGKVFVDLPPAAKLRRESSKSRRQVLISVGDLDDDVDSDERKAKGKKWRNSAIPIGSDGNYQRKIESGYPSPQSSRHVSLLRSANSYPINSDLKASAEKSLSSPDIPVLPPKRRSSTPTSPLSVEQSPDVIWLEKTSADKGVFKSDSASQHSEELSTSPSRPTAKPRKKHSLKKSLPRDIHEWLDQIGFVQYEEQLVSSGWDDLEFLDGLTECDLIDAGILNVEHRDVIVESARKLYSQFQAQIQHGLTKV